MIVARIDQLIAHRSALPLADRAIHLMNSRGLSLAEAFTSAGAEVRPKRYTTRADADRLFEVHDHTIDLMVALSGSEVIHLCAPEELSPGPALPDGADGRKLLGGPRGLSVTLKAGHFIAIFPGEAHMVGGHAEGTPGEIDKLVIKLPVNLPDDGACPCVSNCVRHGNCAECVVWHRDPNNSLPTCLREKGRAMVDRALKEAGLQGEP